MKLLPSLLCIVAALLSQSSARLRGDFHYIYKSMPVLTESLQYSSSQWVKVLQNLLPKIDGPIHPDATKVQPAEAGLSLMSLEDSRIIGGSLVARGQLPWQVGVAIDEVSFCGGSLISPIYVLTAAHCTQPYGKFAVILGATDRYVFEEGRVVVETVKKVVHEKFEEETLANDISILQLPFTVGITKFIRPIRLPTLQQGRVTFVGANATASGWGKISEESVNGTKELYYVPLSVISNAECLLTYGPTYVRSTNICVSGKKFKATCHGDSGGPLAFRESDGAWTQIGVVSYGSALGCAESYPTVFTRVSSYLGWISAKTKIAVPIARKLQIQVVHRPLKG